MSNDFEPSMVFVRCSYNKFRAFQVDVRALHQETVALLYIYDRVNAGSWQRTHPGSLPRFVLQLGVKLSCVRSRRLTTGGKRQVNFLNYGDHNLFLGFTVTSTFVLVRALPNKRKAITLHIITTFTRYVANASLPIGRSRRRRSPKCWS